MSKAKPKKEIKPGWGWGYVSTNVKGESIMICTVHEEKSDADLIPVTVLPTRDYRNLIADAKAYRKMRGKKS